MTIAEAINKVIELARSQIGYVEGPNNANKYAHDFDTIWTDWFNTKKDFNDWCSVFAQWIFVDGFGEKVAGKMLNHSSQYGTRSAVVQYLYRSLQEVGRVGKEPHPGDIIFYHNDKYEGLAQLCHVGIVVEVNGDYVTTIEGNSGKNNTEVATRVINKNYDTKSWGVYGFGYPDYSAAADEPAPTPTPDPKTLDGYTVGEKYKVICKETLNVRTKATTDSKIVTALNPGTAFTCKALTRDDAGNTWMRIDDPSSGWICCIYYGDKYVGPADDPKSMGGYTVGKSYTVTPSNGLNVREKPNINSAKKGALSKGTVVVCRDISKDSSGNYWVKINSPKNGWCAAYYGGNRYLK